MAPTEARIQSFPTSKFHRRENNTFGNWRDVDNIEAYILEGWGEGFMLGALFIMAVLTIANMRKGVLLHKMILLEASFLTSLLLFLLINAVTVCHEPRYILLHGFSGLRLLSFIYRRSTLLLVFHP